MPSSFIYLANAESSRVGRAASGVVSDDLICARFFLPYDKADLPHAISSRSFFLSFNFYFMKLEPTLPLKTRRQHKPAKVGRIVQSNSKDFFSFLHFSEKS